MRKGVIRILLACAVIWQTRQVRGVGINVAYARRDYEHLSYGNDDNTFGRGMKHLVLGQFGIIPIRHQ